MGYRYRLGRFPKEDPNDTRRMTVEQCVQKQKESGYNWSPAYPEGHEELYELGKYIDFKSLNLLKFYHFDVVDEFQYDFWILKKEGLKEIIDIWHKKISKFYEEATDEELLNYCKEKKHEWSQEGFCGDINPYWLDEKADGMPVRSWKYEYTIFNLVFIYRTFDWENDYLIWSAW